MKINLFDLNKVYFGDCREQMQKMINAGLKVNMCVTSPPYWGLRDYGVNGQLGLEETPHEFVHNLVEVFSYVWELLEDDGTLWLNLGDSYAGSGKGHNITKSINSNRNCSRYTSKPFADGDFKPKDLIMIPTRVAIALQEWGWYLRSDIIWNKPNPMPESVKDRPTSAHEHIFLLSKKAKYYYDHEAVMEQSVWDVDGTGTKARKNRARTDQKSAPTKTKNGFRPTKLKDAKKFNGKHSEKQRGHSRRHAGFNDRWDHMTREEQAQNGRNKRNVWTVATKPYAGAHFATFPPKLIEPCVLAGCKPGGIVLDPFMGSGTTAQVSQSLGRNWIGCELNKEYEPLQSERTAQLGMVI